MEFGKPVLKFIENYRIDKTLLKNNNKFEELALRYIQTYLKL